MQERIFTYRLHNVIVLNIFRELFDIEYEIQSMRLIDDYWTGDGISSDSNSIDNNNTSAFCYRLATGGQNLSNHALGRAIDINPQKTELHSGVMKMLLRMWTEQQEMPMRLWKMTPVVIFLRSMVSVGAVFGKIPWIISILRNRHNNPLT